MNRYKIRLWPEKSKSEKINLEATVNTVLEIATEYSVEGRRATNRKWIEQNSIVINGDCIELILCSETWLNVPTKALRGFISKLSKTPEYSKLITASGRLFRGDAEYLEEKSIDAEDLSDEEILIAVTKLFFRENEDNRRKINAIRELIGGKKNV